MRRAILLVAMMALTLLVASGVALAINKIGTDGPDTLMGTNGSDNLTGLGGNDDIFGLKGRDNMALRAGARGYVLKDADEEEMVHAIQAVGRGEAIFSPAIATRVLAYFAAPGSVAPPQVFPTLTHREREILKLIAQGHSNPAIARQLSLSTKTVGNYVSNIFTKLQVADRAQAIIRAREAGLG